MAVKATTISTLDAIADATPAQGAGRDALSGIKIFKAGETDYHRLIMETFKHLSEASAGWFRVVEDDVNATTVRVMSGRVAMGGVILTTAGTSIDLAAFNDATAYVYLKDDGTGAVQINAATTAAGWPSVPHLKLAEVTLASGAITTILDRRGEAMLLATDDLTRFALSITAQGSTAGASTIKIALQDRHGSPIQKVAFVRVRVCDDGLFATATNATIAAGVGTTVVETITATKDLVFQSDANGESFITVTDATAETVTLRIGTAPVSAERADYTTVQQLTHA